MRRVPLAFLFLVVAAYAMPARAGDPYTPGSGVNLELGCYRTHFSYPDHLDDVHACKYGVTYTEPVSEDLSFSMVGGYASLNVDQDPVATQQDYTGRYLGLKAGFESYAGDYLNLAAQVSYTWHDVNGAAFQQRSEITWYETYASLGPVFRTGPWRFELGGYYQYLDGDELDEGTVNQRRRFGAYRGNGGYVGVAYFMDQDESIALYSTSGARRGTRIVFQRYF